MKLTGFADEAARDLETQIKATQELGWSAISARGVNGSNLHELPQDEFDRVADRFDEAGIHIPEFGSLIGNWGKKISSDFEVTLSEISRAIPRMKRLGTPLIRIMCCSGALYSMFSMARYLFVAAGQVRVQARLDTLAVPVRVAALFPAALRGLPWVAGPVGRESAGGL